MAFLVGFLLPQYLKAKRDVTGGRFGENFTLILVNAVKLDTFWWMENKGNSDIYCP